MSDPMFDHKVELPYAGKARGDFSPHANDGDATGETSNRQKATIDAVRNSGSLGMTWQELSSEFAWHHGQSSGALSVLHKTGHLAKLKATRQHCGVYVAPEFINGRATVQPRTMAKAVEETVVTKIVERVKQVETPVKISDVDEAFLAVVRSRFQLVERPDPNAVMSMKTGTVRRLLAIIGELQGEAKG